MDSDAANLQAALEALSRPDLLVACRRILPEDGERLWPEEAAPLRMAVPKVRRQSGAARIVARDLMARLGHPPEAIPRTRGEPPCWPVGLVGALAHDSDFAVAAVSKTGRYRGIGIDIEPDLPLPPGLEADISTPQELARYTPDLLSSRLLLVIKEAVYKAVNPMDGIPLGFQDVNVDIGDMTCCTTSGWTVSIKTVTSPVICALAVLDNA
ncbi:4'-phosphopantetheinyl transferase superfamily protein [Aestuariivita sp.]|jgi:4'-phosphopantetheinyl transferase EntD|uniref:4'-phosphopantetheinyl transferase family protein n=1 Tax=Aestuariivita sp. TaxID=1872407 RepID=UPI0025BD4C66|nr:4'-phosphopantetheinyl transferase superfamily protein [Aestuariivita sp.]